MIFYFSGFTSGADPEREMGEKATIMMSFYVAFDDPKNKKRRLKPKILIPDKRFQLVYEAREAKRNASK